MLPFRARSSAITMALVAIVALASEAQARHWGHWRWFGHWGQGAYEEQHRLRSSGDEAGTDDGDPRRRELARYRGSGYGASLLGIAVAESIRACGEESGELQHWPDDNSIAQLIAPDESQRSVFEQLRSSAGKEAETLRATCPRNIPADPVARIDISKNAVDALLAALNAVDPALESFYAALGDEQKARLVALNVRDSKEDARRSRRSDRRAHRPEGSAVQSGFAAMCEQWGRALLDLPGRRIERDLRLSDTQRIAFHELMDSSNQAADALAKSCPAADRSLTPVGRLQTMRKRLESIGQAIQTIQPALGHFYETLNDDQKLRFAATN
jgi:hypothetical protein